MNERVIQIPESLVRRWEDHYSHRIPADFYDELLDLLSQLSPLPSIDSMAPGTTFRAMTLFVINSQGLVYATSEFNPSTVCDVTPPQD